MDNNFIITQDEKTKDVLLRKGLELLSNHNGVYIFINSPLLTFSESLKGKIVFTNKLFF